MNASVSIQNLDFAFGEGELQKQILFDVSLEIQAGEIVLLTGPSGSGKTTLLTLIGALRSAQSGSLSVLGHELAGATTEQLVAARRKIGYIFQAHNLLKFLTAQQNVEMSLELHPDLTKAERSRRAAEILDAVGLDDRKHYFPDSLSGGQKQRVAIARALAARPQLILADEPTAALDGKTGRTIVDMLKTLAKEQGCPILMVTHDNRVLDIADRIVHMEDGRLVRS
ncbi:MAG: DevA family ABC transporter ATP-binding protein [Blastocatellia bacterium]|nr:DevA family ABC transporter ATP-binding protein [Blastocatellia bacterium]